MSGRGKGGKVNSRRVFQSSTTHGLTGAWFCRVSERVVPSVTARFSVTTSRVSFMSPFALASTDGEITRYHEARYPPSCSPWRCQAYLWPHLRGDPWCPQDLPRERTYRSPITPLPIALYLNTVVAIMTNAPLISHRSSVTRYVSPMAPPLSVPDIR